MTLPSKGRKLDENEISSIENAVKEAGIQQIHPDKMEAFADHLVEKLKTPLKGQATNAKGWRTCSPLND
jgi:hypothetical protein|tara:strand:- start:52 stop:258 length:207 start_codon:yes stop_codon:yes gene_type:complete